MFQVYFIILMFTACLHNKDLSSKYKQQWQYMSRHTSVSVVTSVNDQ